MRRQLEEQLEIEKKRDEAREKRIIDKIIVVEQLKRRLEQVTLGKKMVEEKTSKEDNTIIR